MLLIGSVVLCKMNILSNRNGQGFLVECIGIIHLDICVFAYDSLSENFSHLKLLKMVRTA